MDYNKNLIFDLITKGELFSLTPEMLKGHFMTCDEMKAIFDCFDSFWQYDGEPCVERPHALLKSERHSNGFISCMNVLKHPIMCTIFANEMVKRVNISTVKVDVVVSSAYSAINLGYEVARILAQKYPKIEYIPIEKDANGNPTIIRGNIDPGKRVLIVNELMTTGDEHSSTWQTKESVMKCNGDNPPPHIIEPSFVLVHRSKDRKLVDGSNVYPIFHFDIQDFWPAECKYCAAGSHAIKPKIANNWNLIHGR